MGHPVLPPAHVRAIVNASSLWARRIHPRGSVSSADLDDAQGDLTLHLLLKWDRYDARRSSVRTFADRVARHAAFNERAALRTVKRGLQATHVGLEDDDDLAMDGIDDDLVREVRAGVAALRPSDRVICAALIDLPVAEAARELGLSRASLRRRIERIRQHFEAAGLHDWLEAA